MKLGGAAGATRAKASAIRKGSKLQTVAKAMDACAVVGEDKDEVMRDTQSHKFIDVEMNDASRFME
jgi:hypothetical protein